MLGIHVHIEKAAKHLNAISRISKFIDENCRISLYNAFIMSHFNYCNIVWHFCGVTNTMKIEKIRVIYNDYTSSYDALLKKSGQSYLYISRIRSIATVTIKCIHQLNPEFLHDCFTNFKTTYELRCSDELVQPKARTDSYGIIFTIREPMYGICFRLHLKNRPQ